MATADDDDNGFFGDVVADDGAHRFGGPWTLIKLQVLEKYLKAYTTALKNQRYQLLYIDAFAGSGDVDMVDGHYDVKYAGSARIALANTPAFDSVIFIEKKLKRIRRLEELALKYPGRDIAIRRSDANEELARVYHEHQWRECRAVLFLDPYGLSVKWDTLRIIAETKAIDVWYLFPLAGLYRQMAMDARAIDETKAASITSCLGTDLWRTSLYSPSRTRDLFDGQTDERHANWRQISEFVTARLGEVFVQVVGPKLLYQKSFDPDATGLAGAPLFALYFAISNPSPAAGALACRMARDIIDST